MLRLIDFVWSKEKNRLVKVKRHREVDNLEGTEEDKYVSDELLEEYIPNDFFRLSELDIKQLNKELPISRRNRDVSVELYLDFMEEYLNRIKLGRVPDRSYYVAAPDGFGKKVFVYQAIKEALRHDLTPTTLLDSHEMYSLLDSRNYTDFYATFDGVEMAFLTLGGAPSNTGMIVLKTALEYCERIGIPLMAISRFEPSKFHRVDVMTANYLGVKITRKGDFGKMQLAGFDSFGINKIVQDIRDREGIRGKNFSEMKKQ